MKLSAPKQITFWIAVIVAVVGVIAFLVTSLGLSGYAFWVLVVAFVILALGNLIEGL
jgi:cytochrome c oxidase subunit IV